MEPNETIAIVKLLGASVSGDILTIEEIFEKLEPFEDDREIYLTNGFHFEGGFDSYRGYYHDLCLEITDASPGGTTVHDLKSILNEALKRGEMTGYKGGDYKIEKSTDVWVGKYGTTKDSAMIVNVVEANGHIYIVTKEN